MLNFTIQYEDEQEGEYRLICATGEEGPWVGYGQVGTIVVDDEIYYALIDDPSVDAPNIMHLEKGKLVASGKFEAVEAET